jgi:hypothetical protein
MSIVFDQCVTMENGMLLCYDVENGGSYIIDIRKKKATSANVSAKEWMKLADMLGKQIKDDSQEAM